MANTSDNSGYAVRLHSPKPLPNFAYSPSVRWHCKKI